MIYDRTLPERFTHKEETNKPPVILIDDRRLWDFIERVLKSEYVRGHALKPYYDLCRWYTPMVMERSLYPDEYVQDYITQRPSDLPPPPKATIVLVLDNISITPTNTVSVEISWSYVIPPEELEDFLITSQSVERDTNSTAYLNISGNIGTTVLEYDDLTALFGNIYQYRVVAANIAGSINSNSIGVNLRGFSYTASQVASLTQTVIFNGAGTYNVGFNDGIDTETFQGSVGSPTTLNKAFSSPFTTKNVLALLTNAGDTTEITLNGNGIDSIVLQYLDGLITANLNDNILTDLDVSTNPALVNLYTDSNFLPTVPVIASALRVLSMDSNSIVKVLSPSGYEFLVTLVVSNNFIDEFIGNTFNSLQSLSILGNPLVSFVAGNMPNLPALDLGGIITLTTLDTNSLSSCVTLDVSETNLGESTTDFSGLTNVDLIDAHDLTGDLASFNFAGTPASNINIFNNPNGRTIDISNSTDLTLTVDGQDSGYTGINLNNSNVRELDLSDNDLSALDSSTISNLLNLNVANNTGLVPVYGVWVDQNNATIIISGTGISLEAQANSLNLVASATGTNKIVIFGDQQIYDYVDGQPALLLEALANKNWSVDSIVLEANIVTEF